MTMIDQLVTTRRRFLIGAAAALVAPAIVRFESLMPVRAVLVLDDHAIPSFVYQWLRNGEPIPGATELSYILSAGDQGAILCRVTRVGLASNDTPEFHSLQDSWPTRPKLRAEPGQFKVLDWLSPSHLRVEA